MFKNIQQGFSKFFTNERIIILVVFLILVWGLITYSGVKSINVDTFTGSAYDETTAQPTDPISNIMISPPAAVDAPVAPTTKDSPLQTVANPSDLLPKDQNSQWAALNPNTMNQGDVLMPDLLQAGYHIGLDTIGQSLRNANLQLRSDPIIPKANTGPWMQSTIEPDLGRVPLEIGQ